MPPAVQSVGGFSVPVRLLQRHITREVPILTLRACLI
nr:MAG TPA: hypothetical protein [Caudoviricetes sp.]